MNMMFNFSERIQSLYLEFSSNKNEYDEASYGVGAIMPQEMSKEMSQRLLNNPEQYGI